MKKQNTAFYPGAGFDIFIPIKYPDIRFFLYFDSLPHSSFGDICFEGSYNPNFIEQLKEIMETNGFKHENTEGDIYIFNNKERGQMIHYETNSVFPRDIKERHYECETLVLCGFDYQQHNFINSYSNIITNNITYHDLLDEKILLSKNVSTMIINDEWEYWVIKNYSINNIEKFVTIENSFITYNERLCK